MNSNIGSLNGKWSILLRFSLAIMPLLTALEVWQVLQIAELKEWRASVNASRWTAKDQANFSTALLGSIAHLDKRLAVIENQEREQ